MWPQSRTERTEPMMKVGLVGLGRMGRAIHGRLAANGCDVTGWDRDGAAAKVAAERGLRLAEHPKAVAAAADVVISIITEDNGVRQVFCGANGFLQGNVTGKLFIEMSTLRPMTGRELAPQVEAAGARLIEAPVLGSIPTVREGRLLALAGGRAEDVERARPVLDKLTRKIVHMGPNGAGYAMKLAVNLGLAAYIQGIAESLALGQRQGLQLEQMLEVLGEAPTANAWLASKKDLLLGSQADITLDLKTLRKDIMSAVATGAVAGAGLPLSAGTLAALSAAVAHGWGDKDIGELPRFFRECMVQRFD
jgi:3-hydroxyisobutyrate dehydrogenase